MFDPQDIAYKSNQEILQDIAKSLRYQTNSATLNENLTVLPRRVKNYWFLFLCGVGCWLVFWILFFGLMSIGDTNDSKEREWGRQNSINSTCRMGIQRYCDMRDRLKDEKKWIFD